MTTHDDPAGRVSYTVKELLSQQTGMIRELGTKIDGLAGKLELKADTAALLALEHRIDVVESQLDQARGSSSLKLTTLPILITIICNVTGWGVVLVASHTIKG